MAKSKKDLQPIDPAAVEAAKAIIAQERERKQGEAHKRIRKNSKTTAIGRPRGLDNSKEAFVRNNDLNAIRDLIEEPAKPLEPTPAYVVEEIARHKVKMFCFLGYEQEKIAALMGISVDTLYKYFRSELDTGQAEMLSDVASNLYNIARGDSKGAVTAAIFILKARARWRDTDNKLEVTGADGKPLQVQATQTFDSTRLTSAQRDALREIMKAAITAKSQSEAIDAEVVEEDDE